MATEDSLEIRLNQATDPSMKEEDQEKIKAFCERVNSELEGPVISTRLLAHKIQSPQEKEALYALSTLEACVRACGRYFHQEIGKFRFLNELIKVVSPKYLGNRTTEKVKMKCIEILYSWTKGLPHEPKITEAYKMLRSQGIIKQDPIHMDKKSFDPFPPSKPRKADFEDDEKAKALEKLLRSKHPEDLQAANRLIKSMVKEDAEKTEKRSRRINEIESLNNQVKLLTEMINHYTTSSSKADKDMMKELYENLEKQRPNLFRLASDVEETDSAGIAEILKVNDSVTRVMTDYKQTVEGEAPKGDYTQKDSSLLDLDLEGLINKSTASSTASVPPNASQSSTLLENDFNSLGLGNMNDLGSIFSSASTAQNGQTNSVFNNAGGGVFGQSGQSVFSGMQTSTQTTMGLTGMPPSYSGISHNLRPAVSTNDSSDLNSVFGSAPSKPMDTNSSSLADLDILDKSLLDYNLGKNTFPVKQQTSKMPLYQIAANKAAADAAKSNMTPADSLLLNPTPAQSKPESSSPTPSPSIALTDFVGTSPPPAPELLPLTDVFVPLEKILPDPNIPPVTVYEKNSLTMKIHFVQHRPRPDVITMVVTTLSTNSKPIKNFVFQSAVPKIMKVKLQPPSGSDFAAFNPIFNPTAITQVMLVANPRKEKVRLKYKITYTLDEQSINDVGDVDGIMVQ